MPDSPVSLRIPNVLTYEKTIPTLCPTYEVMKMRNIISAHGGFLYSDHRYGEVSVGLVITAPMITVATGLLAVKQTFPMRVNGLK